MYQPSLWDNIPLETGYRCMNALHFGEAIVQFNEAAKQTNSEYHHIQSAIETCNFWKSKMDTTEICTATISLLLEDFIGYPFPSLMIVLKKTLLLYICELLKNTEDYHLGNIETAFDLLIAMHHFQEAEELISTCMILHPEQYKLFYYLAQAQWHKMNKRDSRINYAKALLHFPDKKILERIEPEELKEIIHYHGIAMAPAYACIAEILPLISLGNEMTFIDAEHQIAIKSYKLLAQTFRAEQNADLGLRIEYRKQLKEHCPDLFNAYFHKIVQSR